MKRFAVMLFMVPAAAMAVTPVNGGPVVGGTTVTINNSPGDQTLPHVSGDIAAYTDVADNRIHYYDFNSAMDSFIPPGDSVSDTLSDVSGSRVSFTREEPSGSFEVAVFDTATTITTVIAPAMMGAPPNLRLGSALGGNTLAYVDFGTGTGAGDIFAVALPSGSPVLVSGSPLQEQNPNVSPAGTAIVWEQCPTSSNCDVMKSISTGGVWSAPEAVVNSAVNEENPDTDGTNVVYDSDRGGATGRDVFIHPLSGAAAEVQLELAGSQLNPSISAGVIGFESTVPPSTTADIYVYVIATNTLYQVTNTPTVNESLNDLSVLADGRVRIVWAADDGAGGTQNIYGITFKLPSSGSTCQNRSETLDASRTSPMTMWSDAHEAFSTPFSFMLPASIGVTSGNAGNKHLTLSWTTDCGVQQKCHYRGALGGSQYAFDDCEGPATGGLHAGSTVIVRDLRLHVDDAAQSSHITAVSVTLAEACAQPVACTPHDDDHHDGLGCSHDRAGDIGHDDLELTAPQPTPMGCSAAGSMIPMAIAALLLLLVPRPARAKAPRRGR
jgi:hypothetical protein